MNSEQVCCYSWKVVGINSIPPSTIMSGTHVSNDLFLSSPNNGSQDYSYEYLVIYVQDTDFSNNLDSLNQKLADVCAISHGKLYGLASLSSNDLEFSASQIEKYSKSSEIIGFTLECSISSNSDYSKVYPLLKSCADIQKPIFLLGADDKFIHAVTFVSQLVSDGIFDHYPELKIVLQNEDMMPQIFRRLHKKCKNNLGNGPNNQYFYKNIYLLSDCSDETYLKYLLEKVGDNHILYSGSSPQVPSLDEFSQNTHKKIMAYNAMNLFAIGETKTHIVDMSKISIIDHKCVEVLSSKVRDKETGYKDFMIYGDRLMTILAEEALARVPSIVPKNIETPTGVARGYVDNSDQQLCVVSIIRSGDILLEAVRKLVPGIRVGKILIQRDEESTDKHAVLYYHKLPKDIKDCHVLLVDPMLGTAGSSMCAMEVLVDNGVKPSNIMFVNLYACEEGLARLQSKYPDMKIITLSIDEYLNDQKYLIPGVGDFGDRYYGTNH